MRATRLSFLFPLVSIFLSLSFPFVRSLGQICSGGEVSQQTVIEADARLQLNDDEKTEAEERDLEDRRSSGA